MAPGGVPTKNAKAPRLPRVPASSLTSFASKLAPTVQGLSLIESATRRSVGAFFLHPVHPLRG
ncbi:hypothetical protein FJD34_08530 [Pseudomonas brenneri]|uniref:Uncharacterized protein n=1 Tax=Pseudomonas brenneri TaxID=129817 RepID=A0A5B2UXM9_9PSED|nr:hypothetical protein F1720_09080 [Pseudomonas brenneri]TWR80319.1 hypothetical protein FJD34_08530 [Pseudomonas brenneri]